MRRSEPSFRFGIEEEYFLVDRVTRDLATDMPARMLAALESVLAERFSTEFMRAQVEIGTPICATSEDARQALSYLRRSIGRIADRHGFAPVAAATHPFARWSSQRHTDTPRYNAIADDLQGLGRRMLINGMHVHIGVEHDEVRIELMNELRQFLPMLLALSTSSPFWMGEFTGLKSYRTAINDATPRRGIPEPIESWGDFKRAIGVLVRAGVIEDATKIWWDLRPSVRFQTLEIRIADVCPLIEDGICIAALVRCLCRCLYRTSRSRAGGPACPLLLINENRWRAERYGMDQGFVDLDGGRVVAFDEVLDDVLELVHEDAEHFDCVAEVEHARTIAQRGTSADRQIATYLQHKEQGLSDAAALALVVDLLAEETASEPALPPMPARQAESQVWSRATS